MAIAFKVENKNYVGSRVGEGWQDWSGPEKTVQYQNRNYKIVAAKETQYGFLTKTAHRLLGALLTLCTLGTPFFAALINKKENALSNKIHELFASKKLEFCVEEILPKKQDQLLALKVKSTSAELSSNEEVIQLLEIAKANYAQLAQQATEDNFKRNYQTKALFMDLAIAQVRRFPLVQPDVHVFQLEDYSRYERKEWMQETLNRNPCHFECTDKGFVYNFPGREAPAITQDPAHKHLGGAALTFGCVVEELQALEMPYFLALLVKNNSLETRAGGSGPSQGFPTPLILDGLYRLFDANALYYPHIYEREMSAKPEGQANKQDVKILDTPHPSPLICIAAPDLRGYNGGQFSREVVEDLFNTCLANFELIKKYQETKGEKAPKTVDAVKLGGGAFKNDESLIYCMQKLAAIHAGIPYVTLHKMENSAKAEALFKSVADKMSPHATLKEWLDAFIK